MTARGATKRRGSEASHGGEASIWWARGLWAGISGLWLMGLVIPSEGSFGADAGVPMAFGWLVLATLMVLGLSLNGLRRWPWSWLDALVALFVVWVLASTAWLVSSEVCQPRAAMNFCFQMWGLAGLYGVARWLFLESEDARYAVGLVLCGTTFLGACGLWQYAVTFPQQRAVYFEAAESQQQAMLREAGLSQVEPESRERRLFEDRLRATEPTGTLTHPNSLATLLAVGWGIGFVWCVSAWRSGTDRVGVGSLVAMLLLIGVCLVLTKGRTAWLGLALVLVVWSSLQLPRKIALLGWCVVFGVGLLGVALLLGLGVLDIEVFSEASKSLWYRVEYWRSTLAMMGEHGFWGVGMGSFQDRYPMYQLAEASETVADPHNWLLEVGATVGVPGMLICLAVVGWIVWSVVRGLSERPSDVGSPLPCGFDGLSVPLGAFVGLIVASLCLVFLGMLPDLVLWGVGGIPAIVLGWIGLSRLSLSREVLGQMLVVGLSIWGLCQLASGGFTSLSVSQVAWLLLAGWATVWDGKRVIELKGVHLWGKPAVMVGLLLAGWVMVVRPVTSGWMLRSQVRPLVDRAAIAPARRLLGEWHRADPYSAEAWEIESELAFRAWMQGQDAEAKEWFQEVLARWDGVQPGSAPIHQKYGQGYLAIYRASGDASDLELACEAFGRAAELSPQDGYRVAQYAFVLGIAGEKELSGKMAARALELDRLNPHADRALSNRRLVGPAGPEMKRTAEQWMELLRSQEGADSQP